MIEATARARNDVTAARLLAATARVEQHHFWFRGLRAFVRPLLAHVEKRQGELRLLDCGCGTGANLTMLGEFGRVFGVDLAWAGLERARKSGQGRIANASVANIPFQDATFDVVTALDVLYALEEETERRALAEILRVLRPGGTLIVNVAALRILRGNHAAFGGELRRSTRRRLRALLERSDFEVARLTYTNATIFPLVLAVRLLQRLCGLSAPEEGGVDLVVPPQPLNSILTAMLLAEAWLLRRIDMPIGSSLLCVAIKPRRSPLLAADHALAGP